MTFPLCYVMINSTKKSGGSMLEKLKKLLQLQMKIYMVYYNMASTNLNYEERKKLNVPLKILGYQKMQMIEGLTDQEVSQMYVKLEKLVNASSKELNLIDFLIYPSNEEPTQVCVENLFKRMDLENCKRKRKSENKEISEYYNNYYCCLMAENIYDIKVFHNLYQLLENEKEEFFAPNLTALLHIYGFIINDFISLSLMRGKDLYDVEIPSLEEDFEEVTFVSNFTDEIFNDLLEDESEEMKELADILMKQAEENSFEEEIEEEKTSIYLNLNGESKEVDANLLTSMEEDNILPQVYNNIKEWLVSYLLNSNDKVYETKKIFYLLLAFTYIKTYTQIDIDDVNRSSLIKDVVTEHPNYNKKEYSISSDLLSSLFEKGKVHKKEK